MIEKQNGISILRGDKIRGGLKKLALLEYLPQLNHTNFAYAGTVFGSGGWALATACEELGLRCSLFIAKSKHTSQWINDLNPNTCDLIWVDPKPVEQIKSEIETTRPDLYMMPLGFDNPDFIKSMAKTLKDIIPTPPPQIWLSALSGALARAACLAFPETEIIAVSPVKHVGDCGHARIIFAPEKFHHPAQTPPPYPACPYSCAKIWQFVDLQANNKAYIINVGYI
ncbi:MAG TPA: hypothetical protein PLK94_03025 [Alphaproteobacteria bacterium]|nr:hypothetical protein [Alphaproteobacteria bacterium]HOO50242.1 hypothetical protein [Alphaproteobacteria bacterium]